MERKLKFNMEDSLLDLKVTKKENDIQTVQKSK